MKYVLLILLAIPQLTWAQSYLPKSDEKIVRHQYFQLAYNEKHEQAAWIAYKLKKSMLRKKVSRSKSFKADPNVKSKSALPTDYDESYMHKGHLVPAADMSFSAKAMKDTFFMSNISPQAPAFNLGIWKKLENKVRSWVREKGELIVFTGPVLEQGLPVIGKNDVSIPDYFYKIVYHKTKQGQHKAVAFLMGNRRSNRSLKSFVTTIDRIEGLTGVDFLSFLPKAVEKRIESSKSQLSSF